MNSNDSHSKPHNLPRTHALRAPDRKPSGSCVQTPVAQPVEVVQFEETRPAF